MKLATIFLHVVLIENAYMTADNLTEALMFLSHFMGDIHQVLFQAQLWLSELALASKYYHN